ncbi:MAG: endonuclease domain-containing protein [Bacteroidetes bacterium]|nr:endonuclease domain-containing protein [Bacteroidota bacterium]
MKDKKYSNKEYNRILQPYAHNLRTEMTKSESCLWKFVLKCGKMRGYKFKRQRPVLKYIADFLCPELSLIIELDGYTHEFEEVAEHDRVRQKELEDAGFTIIRFCDADVLNAIDGVAYRIEEKIIEIESGKLNV